MYRLAFFVSAAAIAAMAACSTSVDISGTGAAGPGGSGGSPSSSSSSTGAAPPKCADPASAAPFEVGGGDACFERLTPGQTVSVMQGPQGGFHLWTGVGCTDCGPTVILQFGIKDPATKNWYAGSMPQTVVLKLDPDGWHQFAGLTAFLPGVVWDETTQLPKGTHVVISASSLDNNNNVLASAEVEVVLGDIEVWDPPCDDNPATCGAPGGLPCCSLGG